VVCDDDIASFFRDVLGALDGYLDAEKFEDDVPECESANLGAIFPMTAETTVKCIRNARDEHNGENDDVIKKG
jgi:hypothetical protein